MSKIMVRKYTDDLKNEIDNEKLVDVLAKLNDWIIRYGHDARLDIDTDSYEDGCARAQVRIVEHRLETDEEYEDRVGRHATLVRQREQQERAEYERLKAKFGE